ncbi:DUF616 domain-containing protein [Neiella marina]|uniref:DUF616 domain-containing protein n=1 Tax=Neiella holothuriorum TaxID=2870530 RepID=A0ABS7EH11_9GAMM|nr:glycosyltransferase domain-containing protein [Neiella holothuriorum]MBW8191634.1 DUF616 domain-containing protein [Neiella holothuriorum]
MKQSLVIYSCMIGGYDQYPYVPVDENIKFVMFTDAAPSEWPADSNWEFVKVENPEGLPPSMLNRYYKFHPHLLFPDYLFSIYIDANISIFKKHFIKWRHHQLARSDCKMAIPAHPLRDCVYEESKAILALGKDVEERLSYSLSALSNDNYPKHNGLFENNLIWRRHHDSGVNAVMAGVWQDLCDENKSNRDQLTLVYRSWEQGVNIEPFWQDGRCCRDSNSIQFVRHGIRFNPGNKVKIKANVADLFYRARRFLTQSQGKS